MSERHAALTGGGGLGRGRLCRRRRFCCRRVSNIQMFSLARRSSCGKLFLFDLSGLDFVFCALIRCVLHGCACWCGSECGVAGRRGCVSWASCVRWVAVVDSMCSCEAVLPLHLHGHFLGGGGVGGSPARAAAATTMTTSKTDHWQQLAQDPILRSFSFLRVRRTFKR